MDAQVLLKNLVEKKLIDQESSEKILRESFLTQKSVEEIIFNKRLVDDVEMAKTKSQILNDAENLTDRFVDAVGKENFFLEIQFNKIPAQYFRRNR